MSSRSQLSAEVARLRRRLGPVESERLAEFHIGGDDVDLAPPLPLRERRGRDRAVEFVEAGDAGSERRACAGFDEPAGELRRRALHLGLDQLLDRGVEPRDAGREVRRHLAG